MSRPSESDTASDFQFPDVDQQVAGSADPSSRSELPVYWPKSEDKHRQTQGRLVIWLGVYALGVTAVLLFLLLTGRISVQPAGDRQQAEPAAQEESLP